MLSTYENLNAVKATDRKKGSDREREAKEERDIGKIWPVFNTTDKHPKIEQFIVVAVLRRQLLKCRRLSAAL